MYNIRILSHKALLSVVILFFSTFSWATDQIPELFMYQDYTFYYNGGGFGDRYPLYSLAKYKEYRKKMNMEITGEINGPCLSTGCYRGYQGTWKIEGNTLFLLQLKNGCYNDRDKDIVDMKQVFGSNFTQDGVKAFWVTDTISLSSEPINSFTIGNKFSFLTLIVKEGHIIKIIEEGPFFAQKPKYIDDKYNLASNQLPEIIMYDNKKFYAKGDWNSLYQILADDKYVARMNTDEYGELELSSCFSSGCYRSYQAIWEVSNDTFYLKEVQDFCTQKPIFDLEKIFGKEILTSKGVPAFWISHELIVSSKEINEFELKAGSIAPTYLKLKIEQGIVVKKEIEH